MRSNTTEPRSITSQLVLLFAPASALILICGLGALYWIVVQHAIEEDTAYFADKMNAIRALGPEGLREELQRARAVEYGGYWLRLIDARGTTVAETPRMDSLLPTQVFGEPTGTRMMPKDYSTGGRAFSLVATSQGTGDERFVVQIAQDRSEDKRFARNFGALLAAVILAGIVASAVVATRVAKRGLRPLSAMAASLAQIGPTHLDRRVPPTGWPRELQPLAVAFDELLDRLQDSFTRLSQFSADLAHELRTPVANLRGEAEVALTRPRSADEYREVLESSVAETQRLSGIIDNLLFVARAEAAEGRLQPVVFNAHAAAEKIAAYYRSLADDRAIKIECNGHAEVLADPALFERALGNLVDNSLRFTPNGGRIEIGINGTNSTTEVSVSDNGCGIAPEHLPRIFDRFYRVDSSRSSRGTGLGLALVKSIAELHGGSARVASEPGQGTTTTLDFPHVRS